MNPLDTVLTVIAEKNLGIETLETRKSDGLDFHEVSVWSLRDALEAAFKAGAEMGYRMPKATEHEIASDV